MNTTIRPMINADWPLVSAIYQQGINTGMATFETQLPDWGYWNQKYHAFCRLVILHKVKLSGWATLAPISSRAVYRGVAEVSVYIDEAARGLGLGFILLQQLVKASEAAGIWTLQSSIFPENKASIYIHQKAGFRMVGTREKIGQLDGVWRDNVLMEKRSGKI